MKRFLSLLLMVMFTIGAWPYDFSSKHSFYVEEVLIDEEIELYYAINEDGKTVSVVQGPETYSYPFVEIPDYVTNNGKQYKVTTIGASAFSATSQLVSLKMSDNIEIIQSGAFGNSYVARIEFSKGLKRICDSAFSGIRNLTSVFLYEGLEYIGRSAFEGSGDVFSKLQSVHLPESLMEIGERAFSNNHNLVEINIPKNIKEIKECTFICCQALKTIVLPEGLKVIAVAAFDTSGLENITFPSSLTEIGYHAFQGTKLQKVVLPNSV